MKQEHRLLLQQFELYLLSERCVAKNTFLAYKRDIEQLIVYVEQQNTALIDIKPAHLKSFLAHLYCTQSGARTIARKISSIRAFFTYQSVKNGTPNKASVLQQPKLEKRLPRYLSEKEIDQLLSAAQEATGPQNVRNRIILSLLYVSGMRVSELTHLRISHIRSDGTLVAVQGKGGKERLIPIPSLVAEFLCSYVQNESSIHDARNKEQFLFPFYRKNRCTPITRQACWLIVQKVCRRAGINRSVSPHQLRHSFATHMLKNGANLRSLQLLLGHERLTTVQIYTHIDKSHLRIVYDEKHPRS